MRSFRLEEWKSSLENARQFNDLLLRIRAFGIPVVVAVMGGGVSFGPQVEFPLVPVRWASWAAIVLILVVPLLAFAVVLPATKRPHTGLTRLEMGEALLMLLAPVVVIASTAFINGVDHLFSNSHYVAQPIAVGILGFALALLGGLYLMDRYYYFLLLIGSVTRAEELEQTLRFRLTQTVTDLTPRTSSRDVITTMYFLPGFLAELGILIFVYVHIWNNTAPT